MAKKKSIKAAKNTDKDETLAQRVSGLDAFCSKFNESVGRPVFGRLSENPELLNRIKVDYIETASLRVNNALGGGWPRRKVSVITGDPDSGKSFRLLEDIAHNQQKDPNFIGGWVETEHSITEKDLAMFGIDLSRFYFFDTTNDLSGEQIADMLISALLSEKIDMLVVNSLKGLIAQQELEGTVESNQIGAAARMNAKILRKIVPVIVDSNTALIFVQTMSTKIGQLFGNPMHMGGGYALKYSAIIVAELHNLSIGETDPISKEEGRKINFIVKKNHCKTDSNPYVKAEYYVIYGQGTDRIIELVDLALKNGYLVKSGSFFKVPDENGNPKIVNGEKYQWQGLNKFRKYCLEHNDFMAELEAAVKDVKDDSIEDLSDEEIAEIKAEEKAYEDAIKNCEDDDKNDIIEKAQ